jgi:hypothetical protein
MTCFFSSFFQALGDNREYCYSIIFTRDGWGVLECSNIGFGDEPRRFGKIEFEMDGYVCVDSCLWI